MLLTLHHCSFNFNLFFSPSPQAIFKDPFRGGNNILVRAVILERRLMACGLKFKYRYYEVNLIYFVLLRSFAILTPHKVSLSLQTRDTELLKFSVTQRSKLKFHGIYNTSYFDKNPLFFDFFQLLPHLI